MKHLLMIVLVLCIIFPSVAVLISNGLEGLLPIMESIIPIAVVMAGLYMLIKRKGR